MKLTKAMLKSKIVKTNQIQTIILYSNFVKASNKVEKRIDKLLKLINEQS